MFRLSPSIIPDMRCHIRLGIWSGRVFSRRSRRRDISGGAPRSSAAASWPCHSVVPVGRLLLLLLPQSAHLSVQYNAYRTSWHSTTHRVYKTLNIILWHSSSESWMLSYLPDIDTLSYNRCAIDFIRGTWDVTPKTLSRHSIVLTDIERTPRKGWKPLGVCGRDTTLDLW